MLSETVTRTTSRVVLDAKQASLDPGCMSPANCSASAMTPPRAVVVVIYDAALSTAGGTRVETRRFEASVPADGTAATVGPALNRAANQVALEVAKWIGG